MAEIRTTLYSRELQKQIFPDNSFYKKSIAETGVADDVITVEKPIQNKISEAKEGAPDSLPLKIETSTDTKKTYDTTLLYCQPLLIDSQSELLTNYSKRQTKQEQQAAELNNKAADYCAYHWFPTKPANRLLTTGAARASNVVGFSSNRKALTKDDLLKVQNLMMRMNVGGLGGSWFGMLTPDMYTDIMKIPEFVDYYKTGNESKLQNGIIGRLLGIELMVRTTDNAHAGIVCKADFTPQQANVKMTDDLLDGALFWNDKMLCRAEGMVRTVVNENAPGYMGGTILEAFCRFGADIVREDQKGVIVMLESK